ncbi:unnamed protein product [Withania somnifera]
MNLVFFACNIFLRLCSSVWDSCQNIPITNSPFAPSLQTKAGGTKNSNSSLLTDFWQSKADFCEAFEQVSLKKSETLQPPNGMCVEKIAEGAYLNMPGKFWLATIPDQDSGERGLDESNAFADLTDEVYLGARFGMMGMAFHPNFAKNGRFFASFNCDKSNSPSCAAICACNSDFSADGTAPNPSMAEKAKPSEVRRIFKMRLPFTANPGGQILFGPEDGYLYFMVGDGGSKGHPFNFAQNNLYSPDKDLQPEIWTLGLRDPWRCSFDSETPSYFIYADVGQDFIDPIFPVLGYSHSDINKEVGSAAISGGYIYRSKTDPCIYGSYLYGDLYAKNFWEAQENLYNTANFTARGMPFSCAHDSPLNCSSVSSSPLPALVLTSTGVYRVVRPSRCNYTCSMETARTAPSDGHIAKADLFLVIVLYCLLL